MSDSAARDAIAAAGERHERVEVTGSGTLADALRSRLGSRCCAGDAAPDAAIDTTGEPAVIRDLLARVADLGVVVLAGPPATEDVELDLYADLHVRGLTLTAVASSEAGAP